MRKWRPGVREAVSELIVGGNRIEVLLKPQDFENAGEDCRAHGEIARLELAQGRAGDEGAFGHLGLAHSAAKSGGMETRAE